MRQEWQLVKGPRLLYSARILGLLLAVFAGLVLLSRYAGHAGPPWPTP